MLSRRCRSSNTRRIPIRLIDIGVVLYVGFNFCLVLEPVAGLTGDILQWDQSNKNYTPTHGVSEVDWRFYKSPRPGPVFDTYIGIGGKSNKKLYLTV